MMLFCNIVGTSHVFVEVKRPFLALMAKMHAVWICKIALKNLRSENCSTIRKGEIAGEYVAEGIELARQKDAHPGKEEIIIPKTMNIPEEQKNSFFRLMNLVPEPFKKEEQIQNDVLLFLKLEGEEFVRNKILQSYEIFKDKIEQGSVAVKRKK